jgi:tRNA nucleotidyltransferase (CCA-adding enzyme)
LLAVVLAAESAAARARTWDNHVNSVVLYHLSYGGTHCGLIGLIRYAFRFPARIDTLSRTCRQHGDMSDEFDAVVSRVRDRVRPAPEERNRLDSVVADLTERAQQAVADLPVDATVVQVGSTARDTWLAGDRDIDLFVSFPPDLERDQLEEYGLAVGHAVLPNGHEEYAEHPYVVGEVEGFAVDLVPCYDVSEATDIQSAVDRTPFHTRYLEARLDEEIADEIRVCKQFFTGIGVYGSDLRTRGFSGFLTELLVLEYGGFRPLVTAVADWQPPVRFDPERHDQGDSSPDSGDDGDPAFDDPLVVVDPTDPGRNVAAVCSPENVTRLQHYARALLSDPREALFEPTEAEPIDGERVRELVADRGTTPVALRCAVPGLVDDQLWPQLEKSREGIASELDRRGFEVFRSEAFATDGPGDSREVALLFELEVSERPRVERHEGPPVHVRAHATGFYEKYADADAYGPFIEGDRYVVEREREFVDAVGFLESEAILDVALGTHVESALQSGYDVVLDDGIAGLADTFGRELGAYLSPSP